MTCKPFVRSKLWSLMTVGVGGTVTFGGISVAKGNEDFYSNVLMPFIHRTIDPEKSHQFAIKLAKYGLVPKDSSENSGVLQTNVWGLSFQNPVGLAAGFDKDGQAVRGLSKLGFGFLEVGSVTPYPQEGNEKPRVFRLENDKAIINRYGFNSSGHDKVISNLEETTKSLNGPVVIGINLGKNKSSENAVQDYLEGLKKFGNLDCVKYFVVNVSSPNTAGLRNLQEKNALSNLLSKLVEFKAQNKIEKPLLLKIAPDLTKAEKEDIASVVNKINSKSNSKIDGLIVCNTTIARPAELQSEADIIKEAGGLSGKPLNPHSTETIRDMYRLTKGKVPIVGVGGIFSGQEAYEKIKAGASLIQIYTALAYEGPPVVGKIKRELTSLLERDGYARIKEAVGSGNK